MNRIASVFVALITLFFASCNCKDECFTPPLELNLRILDSNNNDLLFNESYFIDSVQITSFNRAVEFDFIIDSVQKSVILVSNEITWESNSGTKEFLLYLNSETTDSIYLDVQHFYEDCCTYHDIVKFQINDKDVLFDQSTFAYSVIK